MIVVSPFQMKIFCLILDFTIMSNNTETETEDLTIMSLSEKKTLNRLISACVGPGLVHEQGRTK